MRRRRTHRTEQVVFRNAQTGVEIGRTKAAPKMATGALVTPGENGEFLYLGLAGDIFEITAEPRE